MKYEADIVLNQVVLSDVLHFCERRFLLTVLAVPIYFKCIRTFFLEDGDFYQAVLARLQISSIHLEL